MDQKSKNVNRLSMLIGILLSFLWFMHIWIASGSFHHIEEFVYWIFVISGLIIFYLIGYFFIKEIFWSILKFKIFSRKPIMDQKSKNVNRLSTLIGILLSFLWFIHIWIASGSFHHIEEFVYWFFVISGLIIFYLIGYFSFKEIYWSIFEFKIFRKK